MTNALITSANTALDFSRTEVLETLKHTLGKDLTTPEFLLFIEHCKATKLNPFKKEVWCVKAGGRLQIMTGINGFLSIANHHPQFDGMEVEVDNDDKPTKATCRVWRKDRKFPAVGVAMLREYAKDTPIWRQMPRVMLTKVAKSIAIREAFPQELNGIYTDDEMPPAYHAPAIVIEEPVIAGPTYYDLSLLPEDKRDAAQKLLEAAKADYVDGNIWLSPEPIKKLIRAHITQEQMEAAIASMEASDAK